MTGLGELCGFAPRAPSPAFVILNLIQDPDVPSALLGPDFRQDDERWGGEVTDWVPACAGLTF